ncbi:hypothetical protein RDV64_01635 [Acuticoccus sp. MNP-M23]|uniref:hypothetical protein n=1 Tax=Acuticoccus sp. MNP-M23 TaxID=3072793 RepID=UPI0028160D25|nr:hypothetical protein [Acuticoccus sp. MNP-M23]WMS43132.1 hypothetical protein RDV64_01635 [Acuticoccus sp. MNP-M23]
MGTLKPASFEAEDGAVLMKLRDENGDEHTVRLSPIEVGLVVSGLYGANAKALAQTPSQAPEFTLPIHELQIADTQDNKVLRVSVTEGLSVDFYTPKTTELALALELFSEAMASIKRQTPRPFGGSTEH